MKFLLPILLFLVSIAHAQETYMLNGQVLNADNEVIVDGTVVLLNADNQAIVKSGLITNGKFIFEAVAEGNYTVQISALGYDDSLLEIALHNNQTIKVVLITKALILDEVAITAPTKTFTNTNGNIKVDVANSVFKAATNPLDLLGKLPTIQISADRETLSVIGRGQPLIYIDNQKVGVNDLNALSVEDIKTIEIIKNPSSKYEAEGRAVVLITRKLSKKEGFEVVASETASIKRGYNNFLGGNTNFKKGKTEFKANFNYNQLYHWESHANNLNISDAGIATDYHILSLSKRPQYIFGAGVFHQLNEDDYISFNINSKLQGDDDKNRTLTYILQDGAENNITTLTRNDDHRNFVNSFINYSKKLKIIDAKLFTGLQYSNFNQTSYSNVENNYNNTNFTPAQNRDQMFTVNAFSGRADIEKTFKNFIKWEAGALYLSATAKTNFRVNDYLTAEKSQSVYNFDEKNSAAYAQVSGKLNKLTYSGGLRAEVTDIEGKYNDSATLTIDKHYTNLFPKAQLEYAIDSTMTLNLNYARSIARPNYSSTSQVTVYGSPVLVFSNNLNLNPTITNEVYAGFQYKSKSVTLRYYRSSNPSYTAFNYDANQELIYFNTINYSKESGFNLDAVVPFSYKFWSCTNVLSVVLNKIEDPSAVLNQSKPYLYYYSSNTFKLPKNYTIMLNLWGITKRNEGVFTHNAIVTADAAVSKTFFNVVDCTLSYNNLFGNFNFDENFTVNNIATQGRYFTDVREIALAVKYRFGSFKNSAYKEKSIDDANRVR
ncbi:outer membrane beta-barrel family protein [Flavobacterium subsaxonicum]|nr:outer membrane beta-barrel family protein [Flavobacterium subsaxonicum]